MAADRIAAMNEAAGNDLALKVTSLQAMEERYPGRLEMLAIVGAPVRPSVGLHDRATHRQLSRSTQVTSKIAGPGQPVI